MKNLFTYSGSHTSQISFPLGGIGSGCIGLAGNGRLIDWEIFNRPNKNSYHHYSGFAIKAYKGDTLVDAKMLNSDLAPPYTGQSQRNEGYHSGFGFGPNGKSFAGFPHFRDVTFDGRFPMAKLRFLDESFPAAVTMEAFNPFIPLNDDDSSIPAAFFEFTLENTTPDDLEYAVCLAASSSFDSRDSCHTKESREGIECIRLGTDTIAPDDPAYGDITIATDHADISYQQYWYRGGWQDNTEMFWYDFTQGKRFANRTYGHAEHSGRDTASLAAHVSIPACATRKLRFVIAWNYPNIHNSWNAQADKTPWKNYYATLFQDSVASAAYSMKNWDRLHRDTALFRDSLFASSLDSDVLEAVSANLSVLKSPTCLRLTDGTFYGFEGCIENEGSCEGSCTHVWNYAYALPYLFPALERSMREADYRYNQREDGKMSFRLTLPIGSGQSGHRACVDGQMGGVIKTYREWKLSGDSRWLQDIWPAVKRSIEFAWAETNEDQWDPLCSGVMTGRQHHTLDMELYGPSSWLGGFYLAALKAGAEMAEHLGEQDTADRYRTLFQKGKAYTDQALFNGKFYCQNVDLRDKPQIDRYEDTQLYWNAETGELKYQIGEGCGIDQVLAQWHANLCGLGELFDPAQTRTALKSLFDNNFKRMRDIVNPWRVFALNDEEGLIICSWPDAVKKPAIPITYSSEVMTGFEYQAACHMIQEGLEEEGLRVVKAIRNRYDGEKRNPWNEIECGSNYARSMASYSLLLTFSGFLCDSVAGRLTVRPIHMPYQGFFSCGSGWGCFDCQEHSFTLTMHYGCFGLAELQLHSGLAKATRNLQINGAPISFSVDSDAILLDQQLKINAGDTIKLW